jgi:hypothetical protein
MDLVGLAVDLVWAGVAIGILVLIAIPLISFVITIKVTFLLFTLAIVGNVILYIIGIPVAIWEYVTGGNRGRA